MSNPPETKVTVTANMRCDQCKHWTHDTDGDYPEYLGLGKCLRVRLYWECTEWDYDNDEFPRKFTSEASGNKAFVQDGSDYSAELITLGDFGCVQFEEA